MKNIIWIFLLIIQSQLMAQSVILNGSLTQGSILFGYAENIKRIQLDNKNVLHDSTGNFILGFDRNDSTNHLLVIELKNKTIIKNITPIKRDYKIQRINRMKSKYVSPPKELNNRIKRERKITNEAKKQIGNIKTALFIDGFVKPIKGGRISSVFGSQRILNGTPKNPHNGIDIAVPKGTPVKAMANGKILLSADNFFYAGNYIIIDHGLGLNSYYLHLNKSLVKNEQFVRKGETIGYVGTTGRSTGPHLHWTVQWFDKRIDPNSVFDYITK